jgi:hypothetical protein
LVVLLNMDAASAAFKALPALGVIATGNQLLIWLAFWATFLAHVLWLLPDWLAKWKRLRSEP